MSISPPKYSIGSQKYSIVVNSNPKAKDAESITGTKRLLESKLEVNSKVTRKNTVHNAGELEVKRNQDEKKERNFVHSKTFMTGKSKD